MPGLLGCSKPARRRLFQWKGLYVGRCRGLRGVRFTQTLPSALCTFSLLLPPFSSNIGQTPALSYLLGLKKHDDTSNRLYALQRGAPLEVTGSPQIPVTREGSQNKTVNLGQAQAPPVGLPEAQCPGDSGGASCPPRVRREPGGGCAGGRGGHAEGTSGWGATYHGPSLALAPCWQREPFKHIIACSKGRRIVPRVAS